METMLDGNKWTTKKIFYPQMVGGFHMVMTAMVGIGPNLF